MVAVLKDELTSGINAAKAVIVNSVSTETLVDQIPNIVWNHDARNDNCIVFDADSNNGD